MHVDNKKKIFFFFFNVTTIKFYINNYLIYIFFLINHGLRFLLKKKLIVNITFTLRNKI